MIEAVTTEAKAPSAAREPDTDDLTPHVMWHYRGRILLPVLLNQRPVDSKTLAATAPLAAGLFHILKPPAPAGKLDDVRWRQIFEDGEAEAIRAAAAKAAEFVLVNDILHRYFQSSVSTVLEHAEHGALWARAFWPPPLPEDVPLVSGGKPAK